METDQVRGCSSGAEEAELEQRRWDQLRCSGLKLKHQKEMRSEVMTLVLETKETNLDTSRLLPSLIG
ncbi:hypothetical protein INR49_006843 [Caranx melampygus]|nr:hypothetical protein INR49_006843 [Caranx melampygus]